MTLFTQDLPMTKIFKITLGLTMLSLTSTAAVAGGMFPAPQGWEGLYAGVNGGYAQANVSDGNTVFPDVPIEGNMVGVQAGVNLPVPDGLVLGVQGDMDWLSETGKLGGTGTTIGAFNNATITNTIDWEGSLTAHLGVHGDGFMAYGLAGATLIRNTLNVSGVDQLQGASPMEADISKTLLGWTVGTGVSVMVDQVAAFVEYRYSDFEDADYSAAVGDEPVNIIDQQVRLGLNYHMR
jgi:opacity protein-like surface antigen